MVIQDVPVLWTCEKFCLFGLKNTVLFLSCLFFLLGERKGLLVFFIKHSN